MNNQYGNQMGWGNYPMQSNMNQFMHNAPAAWNMNQPSLNGKTISSENEIQAGDVMSNGEASWFPMRDGSCIVCRQMNSNGLISSIRYVPETPAAPEPTQADRIESKLNEILTALSNKEIPTNE